MQETFNRTTQILREITQQNTDELHIIYDSAYVNPFDRASSLKFLGFVTDLRVKIDITSLSESTIPDIPLGATNAQKSTSIRDMEYGSQRFELQLLMRTTYQDWLPLFNFSLLNRRPFYVTDMMSYLTTQPAFAVASDAQLAIRIIDVGYGLLQGDDRLIIFGSAREEVTGLPSEGSLITQARHFSLDVDDSSELILQASNIRKGLTITNLSQTHEVTLSYQPVAIAGDGIMLLPYGGSFTINTTNLYKGAISAISQGANTKLAISEFM